MKTKEHYVYKYTQLDNNNVIYVGKTDASLKQRIEAHEKEDKFFPYRGNWKIEYLELANNVETDIVEKYLINKLKPVLNEKDNTAGLTSMIITLPNWVPYSKYEEKKKKDLELHLNILRKKAITDYIFFQNVYDAICENKDTFVCAKLHPTGVLLYNNRFVQITNPEVFVTECGYEQKINPEVAKLVENFPKQFQLNIWKDVACSFDWDFKTKDLFDHWMNVYNFTYDLYEFKDNGYLESDESEKFFLTIPNNADIIKMYSSLFSSIRNFGEECVVEINWENYENLPYIQEKIANEILELCKTNGVIPYADDL